MSSGHTGMGEQPKHGMREIDLATGKYKEIKPLKDALDYRRWDSIAVRAKLPQNAKAPGDTIGASG